MSTVTDRIEKTITLRAPVSRVWRAITDVREFGAWFGVNLDGPFTAEASCTGVIRPTKADPEIAKLQEPHAGKRFDILVEQLEPERFFSFRWHPFAIEPGVDYSKEPMTLVAFDLRAVEGGTLLSITESGFDRIPLERRARAFAANDGGWTHQAKLLEKHLAIHAG